MPETITETQEKPYIANINEAAEFVGLTPRRVRQLCEDGALPRQERGSVDAVWLVYHQNGARITANWMRKPKDGKTLVAIGWLSGVGGAPKAADITAFGGIFERNGFDRDTAMMALGTARGLLGAH